MKTILFKLSLFSLLFSLFLIPVSRAEEGIPSETIAISGDDATAGMEKPKEEGMPEEVTPVKPVKTMKRTDRADAFVAGADWEFDGFVAGGQDSNVRSMFYLNDLLYINVGSQQGIATGDKVGIYKRGDRIRDPQTGKFIGYEVAAVRVTSTYEPVEIGDLVRREQ